ncbi:hypothetical protein GGTG_07011 [Gaeumannomyces tritici R3-111a-1]|uniref:Uncharacterized protein n=1 Tax=Gaeumannomyces tritici (strain R3-111a-1) TaxID=644352 RepID=J3P0G5_GAET3|nr:hypothetical protein GGTG_07011 [Gaeumannomyces tritici R3-111a-1]EJT77098.1 hypothetical protein GGTG_07011 [Gaeumannomyces tritici R3-111a-1]
MQWIRPKQYGKKDAAQAPPPPPVMDPDQSAPAPTDVEAAALAPPDEKADTSLFRRLFVFSRRGQRPTLRQWLFILGPHGLGAMLITGAINVLFAYLMYVRPSKLDKDNKFHVTLWALPGTVAGDAAVTIIMTCVITWMMEMLLVRRALRSGAVQPLAWPQSSGGARVDGFERWFYMVDGGAVAAARVLDRRRSRPDDDDEQSQKQGQGLFQQSPRDLLACLGTQLVRSVVLVLPAFILFWPLPLVIFTLTAGRPMQERQGEYLFGPWAAVIYKGVLSALQALWITPEYAIFWMTRAGYSAPSV